MRELGVFHILLENDLLIVDKILGLTFLKQEKTSKDSKRRLLWLSFVLDGLFTTPIYSHTRGRFVNSAFLNKENVA